MDPDNPPIDRFPRKVSELREALRAIWCRLSVTKEGEPSPGEGVADLVPWPLPKPTKVPKKLRLWLMIYDEAIAWVCNLNISCELSLTRKSQTKQRDLILAIYRLSGRIASDLYAVRSLVCCGLEPAARVVLRSAMEHIDTASLLMLEPDRASDFLSTKDPSAGNAFWHRHLSKDKLRNRIRHYFRSLDEGMAAELLAHREHRNVLYGVAVHPSAYTSDMALFSPEAMQRDPGHIGIGYPTDLSCNALHTMQFGRFSNLG